MTRCSGFTLTELIVVIALIGLVSGIAGLAVNTAFASPPAPGTAVAQARARAVAEGRTRRVEVRDSTGAWVQTVLVLPDGRVLGSGIDQLTGERDESE